MVLIRVAHNRVTKYMPPSSGANTISYLRQRMHCMLSCICTMLQLIIQRSIYCKYFFGLYVPEAVLKELYSKYAY